MTCYTNKNKVPFEVDASDVEALSYYSWSVAGAGYLYTNRGKRRAKDRTQVMHEFLFGKAPIGLVWDHKDGNKLDNTRDNLQLIHHKDNIRKGKLQRNNTSGHKGVSWHKQRSRWYVRIKIDGKVKSLGLFVSLDAAATARKEGEKQYWSTHAS